MGFTEKHIIFNGSRSLTFGKKDSLPDTAEVVQVKKKKEMGALVEKFMADDNASDLIVTGMPPKKLYRLFKNHFKFVKAGGGLVRNPAGEYLFIRRLNKWDLPKGALKKRESPEEGAMREVIEETGITGLKIEKKLPNTRHVYVIDGIKHMKKTYWFLMTAPEKQELIPQTEEDITEVVWLEREKSVVALKESYRSLHDILKPFIR